MNYLLKYSVALLLLTVLLSSCRKEPHYPDAPTIEFKRVEQFHFNNGNNIKRDSIVVVVGYQDGDGNLGLRPIDQNPQTTDPDSKAPFDASSDYNNNFITDLYIKKPLFPGSPDSSFVKFQFPVAGSSFSGRFPRLSNDDREEPLEGEIKYTVNGKNGFTSDIFKPGTIIKFEIFIYDRETPVPNKSNVIETSPIKLF
ncbi:hypothetical protein ACSX1A_03800 [Pontibacter sp. MBLB2868]|uniref:hypothetical protein n=1 Tax=Pontibacter sp. MBLB2868 TaxID=3451555 RepID=UPI003F74B4AF